MSYYPVLLGGTFVILLVCSLLNSYGNRRTCPWYVQVVVFVSWLGPFCVPFLLPLDLTSTLYQKCEAEPDCNLEPPYAFVPAHVLHALWSGVYWSSFCLTWGTIPILQSYITSGGFDFYSKLKSALRANVLYYLFVGLLGGLVLIWVAGKKEINTTRALMAFVMAAANSWGLTLIIVFLGYGLVAIPREMWQSADAWWCLRRAEFRAAELCECVDDADVELHDVVQELVAVHRRVPETHPHRGAVNILMGEARGPDMDAALSSSGEGNPPDLVTLEYLTNMNIRLQRAIRNKDRATCLWKNLCRRAFLLQDIVKNSESTDRRFRSKLLTGRYSEERWSTYWWWWYVKICPMLQRVCALTCGLMSFGVIWSELTFNVKNPTLSFVGLAFHNSSYGVMEIIAFVTLTYMCVCSYTSLMKLRVFSLYELVPNHHTDPRSLLFAGSYLCRLTMPLCYNFLNLATEDISTVFSTIMGKIDLVPLFGSTYNDWIPITLLIPVFLTVFNVYHRVLHLFGIRQLFSTDDDDAEGDIGQGRILLNHARSLEENGTRDRTGASSPTISLLNHRGGTDPGYRRVGAGSNPRTALVNEGGVSPSSIRVFGWRLPGFFSRFKRGIWLPLDNEDVENGSGGGADASRRRRERSGALIDELDEIHIQPSSLLGHAGDRRTGTDSRPGSPLSGGPGASPSSIRSFPADRIGRNGQVGRGHRVFGRVSPSKDGNR